MKCEGKAIKIKKVACSECGKNLPPHSLEIHHKDGNHQNNDLNNLTVLCTICHRSHHNAVIKENQELIKTSNQTIRYLPMDHVPTVFRKESIRAMSLIEQTIAREMADNGWIKIIDGGD
jgi:hypothetical protein